VIYPDTLDRATHVEALQYEIALIMDHVETHDLQGFSKSVNVAIKTYLEERIKILTEEVK
jgi:hypothetical protein